MQSDRSKINSIQFGLFSPATIKSLSVLHVIHPETIENALPKECGLADPRMGSSDFSMLCATCLKNSQECQGHFGHIELTKPVFHIGYLNKIKKVLESVCFYCSKIKGVKRDSEGRPVTPPEQINNLLGSVTTGLNHFWSANKTKGICDVCENKQPILKREGLNLLAFMKANDNEGKILLTPEKVLSIFKKMSDEDICLLGFSIVDSRPEYMILTTLIVAPPATRPAIIMDGLRSEDDLTHKYADIIKSNINLRKYESEGAPTHILRDYEQLLQFHVATLMDNDISGQPQALQKSGRPLKSLSARLKGKEGRLRYNLMGKRVDFSARTVITPDPNLSLDEVGVPISIAMIHTYNESVNSLNIDRLQSLVDAGPNKHPGANYVVRSDGQRMDLRFNRSDIHLQEGYIVERHLQNGDIILFNRQPSLHKMSMMAHRVRVMEKKTFRLNLSVTTPYNADFDGDEMNLHTPQSLLCASELKELASVPSQIVSPQSNRPVMGIVQDSLIGVRKLTLDSVFLSRRNAMQLHFASNSEIPFEKATILRPVELYTGKQVFSWTLKKINYRGMSTDEKLVLIVDGLLHRGVIDKKSVGTAEGGIIHIIYNDHGREACVSFFNSVQRIVNSFITTISGFSIGIGDTVPSKTLQREINKGINDAQDEVTKLIKDPSTLTRLPGMTLRETFESRINSSLNKARSLSGSASQKYLSIYNNAKQMVLAGSKGSLINISQMTACVGQQNVEGKRIPFGFRNRTLPHFPKDDYSPKSRGFVKNSYLTGLTPEEFYFHAMGGREGLIDTAVKTAETGYIQRRLVKAMEDLKIEYDHSVRTNTGTITQFMYGDDGYRGESIERQKVDRKTVYSNLCTDKELLKNLLLNASDEVRLAIREDINILFDECASNNKTQYYLPCNVKRIFWDSQRKFRNHKCTITPRELFAKRNSLEEFVIHNISSNKTHAPFMAKRCIEFIQHSFTIINALRYRMSQIQLDHIINIFKEKFLNAMAVTNEMVGILSAQSVGEPATQMTLNTFHLAGVASTVTLGVPRLKEIINIAKTLKTPSMKAYLKKPYNSGLSAARQAQVAIEYTCLEDILDGIQLVFDPDTTDTVIEEDKDFVGIYFLCPDESIDNLGVYVIRMIIDRERLIGRGILYNDLILLLKGLNLGGIISSDENSDQLIIRLRTLINSEEENITLINKMLKMTLAGYKNVKKVFLVEEDNEIVLQTEGVNLKDLLSCDLIIPEKLYSNDIIEINSVLGIEAAREVVLRELRNVIENEGYVNFRHLSLLSDVITTKGILTGITRHGVNKANKSALMRCSFEETVEILLDAAIYGEYSSCKEVTENIVIGQIAPVGTGCTGVYLDGDMLKDAIPVAKRMVFDFEKGEFGTPEFNSPISQESLTPSEGSWTPSNNSQRGVYNPMSPMFNARSPGFNARSPGFNARSPGYSPTSPSYSPTSPSYSPTSPSYSPTSPSYSPTSPSYSPTSPSYSPTSPSYSPTSPSYSPTSPSYSPTSPSYSPTSPSYSPTSPAYMGANSYSPTSPSYNMHQKSNKNSGNDSNSGTKMYNDKKEDKKEKK